MDYAAGILSFFLHCLNSFAAQASRFNFIVYYPISVDNQRIEHTVQVGAVLELITV